MKLIDAEALKDWIDKYYENPKYNKDDIKAIVDEQTPAVSGDFGILIDFSQEHIRLIPVSQSPALENYSYRMNANGDTEEIAAKVARIAETVIRQYL